MRSSSPVVVALILLAASQLPAASFQLPEPTRPVNLRLVVDRIAGANAFFETLRPRAHLAYAMRSQADLDALDTAAKGAPRLPVTYDPVHDAAVFRVNAAITCDSQQKLAPIGIDRGTLLVAWEFRFNRAFEFKEGYLARHKTWRLDGPNGGFWIAFKTDYQNAAGTTAGRPRRGVAEFLMTTQGTGALAPPTSRVGEVIVPKVIEHVYIEADVWTRVYLFIEGVGNPVAKLSLWLADEARDPMLLYDRINVTAPTMTPAKLRFEYDSSAGTKLNPDEMRSHNRNLLVLKDLTLDEVRALLERPGR